MRNARAGGPQTYLGHGIFELQTVLGLVNSFRGGANQLDVVLFQHAVVPQIQGTVQCRLPPHGGQNRIRALLGNDFFNGLPGDGLNIGDIRRSRVGHDRGWIAVDQDDFVALFAQSLAGLHA